MSGQPAIDPDARAAGAPKSSRRVRTVAAVAGLLSLVVCGAVAQASTESGVGADEGGLSKAAAAAPTSTVAAEEDLAPPDDLGDDPELDSLAQSCFDGDLVACDHLYLQSPADSAYEAYGDTCAGRQEAGTGQYCGVEASAGPTEPSSGEPVPPEGLGTDDALDALAQSCYDGDMAACDELYGSADTGSAYQAYGDTCAGRQPENTGRYCTSLEDPVPGTGVVPTTAAGPTTTAAGPATTAAGPTTIVADDSTTAVETTEPTESTLLVEPGDVPAPTLEPTDLGDDPTLDALAQACYDGDLSACDDLYSGADPGTPYRSYGDTCAGRQPEGTGTWCIDAFAAGPAPSVTETVPPTSGVPESSTTTTTVAVPTPPITTSPPTATTTPPVPTSGPTTSSPGVVPPPSLEPTGLGTDPALDVLAQACYDGALEACDDLWRDSEPDSAYANFADTCAGRQPPNTGTWCVDAFVSGATTSSTAAPVPTDTVQTTVPGQTTTPGPTTPTAIPDPTQQPTGLGDDPAFDVLARSCFDGDMQACDDLFDRAPIRSEYRAYGDTCAGRQEPGTFDYCHVVFPTDPRR